MPEWGPVLCTCGKIVVLELNILGSVLRGLAFGLQLAATFTRFQEMYVKVFRSLDLDQKSSLSL